MDDKYCTDSVSLSCGSKKENLEENNGDEEKRHPRQQHYLIYHIKLASLSKATSTLIATIVLLVERRSMFALTSTSQSMKSTKDSSDTLWEPTPAGSMQNPFSFLSDSMPSQESDPQKPDDEADP